MTYSGEQSAQFNYARVRSPEEFKIPRTAGISYFDSFIPHFMKETFYAGGIVEIVYDQSGEVAGIMVLDQLEKSGTVFTKSHVILDHYLSSLHGSTIFSEIIGTNPLETYTIYELALSAWNEPKTFTHEIEMLNESDVSYIEDTMETVFPGMNRRWVRSAFLNGDWCFASRSGNEIKGLGWASASSQYGRLTSLCVLPRFRNQKIGTDLLHARLILLKSLGVRTAFSEISDGNEYSRRIAESTGFKASSKIYLHATDDSRISIPMLTPRCTTNRASFSS